MPGSQLTTILGVIATTLDGVTGVQRVYQYEPAVLPGSQIPSTLGGSQAIDYWTVRAETSRPRRLAEYQVEIDHVIVIRHYYTAGDTSVTTPLLDPIIQAVLDVLTNTFSLSAQAQMTGPPEITWPVLWMLAETFLVFRSEVRFPVMERYVTQ